MQTLNNRFPCRLAAAAAAAAVKAVLPGWAAVVGSDTLCYVQDGDGVDAKTGGLVSVAYGSTVTEFSSRRRKAATVTPDSHGAPFYLALPCMQMLLPTMHADSDLMWGRICYHGKSVACAL